VLIEKAGVDISDTSAPRGWTPLNAAASNGHLDVVKYLLEKGADTSCKVGRTPLARAAASGHLEVAKVLLQHGADINAVEDEDITALCEVSCHPDAKFRRTEELT
jgi:ankyrin repeat protein